VVECSVLHQNVQEVHVFAEICMPHAMQIRQPEVLNCIDQTRRVKG
jgi:hypothetical protein